MYNNDQTNIMTIDRISYPIHHIQDGNPEISISGLNGIAYFMLIFESVFEDATNALQNGEANLTVAMENITKTLNDLKNDTLDQDLKKIDEWVQQCDADKNNPKQESADQAQLSYYQSVYKNDDSKGQSLLQSMSPVTTADSDLTTTISQNNNTINQMATYVINILKMLSEQLIRLN